MNKVLKRGGDISYINSSDDEGLLNYNYVTMNGDIIGVGLFKGDDEEFIAAIIKNSKGDKEIINKDELNYPSRNGCLDQLEIFFKLLTSSK